MTPSPGLITDRRQALITRTDAAGTPGRLLLRNAAEASLIEIALTSPCGVVDSTGVALATTEYAQTVLTGDVASARLVDGNGVWVSDFTVGLATDEPAPELPLASLTLYAGAFMRLIGSHIACD